MSLEHLWAGWRAPFVDGATKAAGGTAESELGGAGDGAQGGEEGEESRSGSRPAPVCVFCRILASGLPDTGSHVLWRHPGGRVVALLNAYPYTSGHLMVMPVRHVADLEALDPGELHEVMEGLSAAVRALKAAYRPDGLNLGANLGEAAGAGVPGHLHLHVLARWNGDTNFMTAVAETRVLPEALSASAARLRAAWPGPPST